VRKDRREAPERKTNRTPCNAPTAPHAKAGSDNVTGVETPNAQAFADSFKPAAPAVK
jgi:hypothetical protein